MFFLNRKYAAESISEALGGRPAALDKIQHLRDSVLPLSETDRQGIHSRQHDFSLFSALLPYLEYICRALHELGEKEDDGFESGPDKRDRWPRI